MILNEFYEAVMARITTKIPAIKHIDIYFGQDEIPDEETELPFMRPAVLFEYEPMAFESMGNKKQATEASFKLHLISDVIQEVDSKTTTTIRNKGHQHLQNLDALFYHLQGFNGTGFNSISRTGLDSYKPNGMMIKHTLTFRTRLTDIAAVKQLQDATPSQEIITVVLPE